MLPGVVVGSCLKEMENEVSHGRKWKELTLADENGEVRKGEIMRTL